MVAGPDKVAYPMLEHLPRIGMDFPLHIFNLFFHLENFSIISIHSMGKPLYSVACSRPISLTPCNSKIFERIILSPQLFFGF